MKKETQTEHEWVLNESKECDKKWRGENTKMCVSDKWKKRGIKLKGRSKKVRVWVSDKWNERKSERVKKIE